jgi:hypothetical protein
VTVTVTGTVARPISRFRVTHWHDGVKILRFNLKIAAAAGVPAAGDSETCLEDKATVSWPFDLHGSLTERPHCDSGWQRAQPSAPAGPGPGLSDCSGGRIHPIT